MEREKKEVLAEGNTTAQFPYKLTLRFCDSHCGHFLFVCNDGHCVGRGICSKLPSELGMGLVLDLIDQ